MKPFNLEEAKAGKPVCTRDGRKARIICFDARNDQPIVGLIEDADNRYEIAYNYDIHGKWDGYKETGHDLMMCEATDALPKSWEEFCENYMIDEEYFINNISDIGKEHQRKRVEKGDRNLFRTKEQAEAMLAFIQLIRLRDVYRQGWEPDWTKDGTKYSINILKNSIAKDINWFTSCPLSFQSAKIRDKFLENFRDLIEQAKEFI